MNFLKSLEFIVVLPEPLLDSTFDDSVSPSQTETCGRRELHPLFDVHLHRQLRQLLL